MTGPECLAGYTEESLEMEHPLSSCSSDTHPMLSTALGAKLMSNYSSQDSVFMQGSEVGHLCP